MESFAFDYAFGEISAEEFVRTYLNKRPLFIRRGSPVFEDLISEAEFFESLAGATAVRAVFPHLRQARIRFEDAHDMLCAGATICASGLENCHRGTSELADSIRRALGYSGAITVSGYLSPDGQGFSPHFDTKVVTTLQITGSKVWHFSNEPLTPFPRFNSPFPIGAALEAKLKDVGTTTHRLSAGDVLCLPAGTLHWAEACGSSFALNVSFEYLGCGLADQIARFTLESLTARMETLAPVVGQAMPDQAQLNLEAAKSACTEAARMLNELASDPARLNSWLLAIKPSS